MFTKIKSQSMWHSLIISENSAAISKKSAPPLELFKEHLQRRRKQEGAARNTYSPWPAHQGWWAEPQSSEPTSSFLVVHWPQRRVPESPISTSPHSLCWSLQDLVVTEQKTVLGRITRGKSLNGPSVHESVGMFLCDGCRARRPNAWALEPHFHVLKTSHKNLFYCLILLQTENYRQDLYQRTF